MSQNRPTSQQQTAKEEKKLDQNLAKQKFSELTNTIKLKLAKLSRDLPQADNWEVDDLLDTPLVRALMTEEQVLKIPRKVKTLAYNTLSPKTTIVHVDDYHPELSIIKINEFKNPQKTQLPTLPTLSVSLLDKKGQREQYFVNNDEIIKNCIELRNVATSLGIAEFALVKHICGNRAAPLQAWDQFPWDMPNMHGLYYDVVNDPMIIDQYVNQVLESKMTFTKDQPLVVLDIGAGKGRVAHKLVTETAERKIPIHYILVEPGEQQLEIARATLENFSNSKTGLVKLTFIHSTLEKLNIADKAHCIISSGATLNNDIVTRDQAKANVKRLSHYLRPEGVLIATGQTAILVKGKHFKNAGLQVLSYATPCVTPKEHKDHPFLEQARVVAGFFDHYQRYVCRKPAETKDEKVSVCPPGGLAFK